MTDMAIPAGQAFARSKFEVFLTAPIGDDTNDNGMQLSVLSALARQNVDPWEEAAILASLPSETATQKLASLIAGLPKRGSTRPDPAVIAARLIALLPRVANRDIRSRTPVLGGGTVKSLEIRPVTVYVIWMLVMLAIQWFVSTHVPAQPVKQASAPTTGTVAPSAIDLRNRSQ